MDLISLCLKYILGAYSQNLKTNVLEFLLQYIIEETEIKINLEENDVNKLIELLNLGENDIFQYHLICLLCLVTEDIEQFLEKIRQDKEKLLIALLIICDEEIEEEEKLEKYFNDFKKNPVYLLYKEKECSKKIDKDIWGNMINKNQEIDFSIKNQSKAMRYFMRGFLDEEECEIIGLDLDDDIG